LKKYLKIVIDDYLSLRMCVIFPYECVFKQIGNIFKNGEKKIPLTVDYKRDKKKSKNNRVYTKGKIRLLLIN